MTPPVEGAALRAALEASCLRGALPPVDLPKKDVNHDVRDAWCRPSDATGEVDGEVKSEIRVKWELTGSLLCSGHFI